MNLITSESIQSIILEKLKNTPLQSIINMIKYLEYNENKIIRGFLNMKLESKDLLKLKEDLVDLDENIAYLIQDGFPEDDSYVKELIRQRTELKDILYRKSGI